MFVLDTNLIWSPGLEPPLPRATWAHHAVNSGFGAIITPAAYEEAFTGAPYEHTNDITNDIWHRANRAPPASPADAIKIINDAWTKCLADGSDSSWKRAICDEAIAHVTSGKLSPADLQGYVRTCGPSVKQSLMAKVKGPLAAGMVLACEYFTSPLAADEARIHSSISKYFASKRDSRDSAIFADALLLAHLVHPNVVVLATGDGGFEKNARAALKAPSLTKWNLGAFSVQYVRKNSPTAFVHPKPGPYAAHPAVAPLLKKL